MKLWIIQNREDGWNDYAWRTDYTEAVQVKAQLEDEGYLARIVEGVA